MALVALASTARAQSESSVTIKPAITVGALELVGLSSPVVHLGVYTTTSLDFDIILSDAWMIIPSTGFEFAPETGSWGGTFFLIVDRYLTEVGPVVLALEPQIGFVHDAVRRDGGGFDHDYYVAGGVGLAMVTSHGTWIPQVIASVGTAGQGWAVAPTLLFSVQF